MVLGSVDLGSVSPGSIAPATARAENQPQCGATLAGRGAHDRKRQTTSGQRRADAEQLPLPPVRRRAAAAAGHFRFTGFRRFRSEDVGEDEDLERQPAERSYDGRRHHQHGQLARRQTGVVTVLRRRFNHG